MTSYSANLPALPDIVHELEVIDAQLKTTLTQLEESAATTLAHWTHEAKDAYRLAKQKWDAAADQMPLQAKQAAMALSEIHSAYTHGEKFGVGLWNG